MNGRKTITRDMMEAALARRWNAGQTAAHFGFHRKSIESACERFGIVLPLMTFGHPLTAPKQIWIDKIGGETNVKPKVKLSASKAAVERALRKIEEGKRLQATS